MNITAFLPENKLHILITVSAILLTLFSILAIALSLHAAYMWLIVVFMTVLFFTTFTCSARPTAEQTEARDDNFEEIPNVCHSQPCWIIDLPPSYAHATGDLTGNCTPPPSYNKIQLPPPVYEHKIDLMPNIRYGRHGSIQSDHFPEVFSNRFQRRRNSSISSVQTLQFNVIESH
ncbi:uncharacterized protein LOC142325468 [Lycorma delicatula]|uniref:uncharacterized protein LOC142325468 n=1 Tax=Lycorma delicatula TaxID=130591 RepID=UPI003F518098